MANFAAPRKTAFVFLTLLIAACGGDGKTATGPKTLVTEEVSANTYNNDYFGITVTKPNAWHAAPLEQQEQLMGFAADIVAHENTDLKNALDASTKRSYSLFMFTMHELGAPVLVNPNVMGVAEYVGFLPGVKTGSDYFFHMKTLMTQSALQYDFAEQYGQRIIDDVTFDSLDVTMTFNGTSIKQTYYASRQKEHVITIIESYSEDAYRNVTSEIIDTIELDW